MDRAFMLTEKQLGNIIGKVSELSWRQANPIMEILKNATEVKQEEPKEVKQEKKTISNNESGSNGKKS
tara:strand:+ start:682 stop:885 length:204 start_codon:yes stop_codon:yes gene_type:complete